MSVFWWTNIVGNFILMLKSQKESNSLYIELVGESTKGGKLYASPDMVFNTIETMSTFLRGGEMHLYFFSHTHNASDHFMWTDFIERAKGLRYTSVSTIGQSAYWDELIKRRSVCEFAGHSITVRATGAIYPCPWNKEKDVKFKAVATEDITLAYTYSNDITLTDKLKQGSPCDSCLKYCKD